MSTCNRLDSDVWGEPVFSAMAAGWFCENGGYVKPVLYIYIYIYIITGCQLATILRRRTFTRMNREIGGFI
jgi:hypothetical protein